jgi:SAM-dependent methyltransferase
MASITPRNEEHSTTGHKTNEEEQESSSTTTSTTSPATTTTTNSRDNIADWQAFSAHDIPSKGTKLPPLFFEALEKYKKQKRTTYILELGCGCGDLCHLLLQESSSSTHNNNVSGYKLFGTDINRSAIEQATYKNCGGGGGPPTANNNGVFWVADVTQPDFVDNVRSRQQSSKEDDFVVKGEGATAAAVHDIIRFDVVVMQLLLSVVGGPNERCQVVQNASALLQQEPGSAGGTLYLSCSGVSDDINPTYQQLYQQDASLTGEAYSYYSRRQHHGGGSGGVNDGDDILYMTHHFTVNELKELLMQAGGFREDQITIQQHKEASSRRPNEAAYFLYAIATNQ